MGLMKKISLVLLVLLYLLAGVNHFWHSQMYEAIIPPYMGHAHFLNIVAGICEIFLAILIAVPLTRRWGCYLLVVMLIAFVPVHIYMLQANCSGTFCQPAWLLWLRLLIGQPLLIWWAWWHRT